jgi:ubiquinone/menaquinone biosynthesis C-methylase UbiE
MNSLKRKKQGFNLLAPYYDGLVSLFFGRQLKASQAFFLNKLPPAHSILVFGCGTGSFLRDLEKHHQAERICCVDISERMIASSRSLINKEFPQRLVAYTFICGSWSDIPPEVTFDWVITPYVLDCFQGTDLLRVIQGLGERLTPDGKWLFTDFHVPKKGFFKWYALLVIRILYAGFQLICGLGIKRLPDFETFFSQCHLKAEYEKYFCRGLLTSKIYSRQSSAGIEAS